LVVEDGERVRRLTITRLKLIGYQVLEANDGPKAIDILSKGHPVDLVFPSTSWGNFCLIKSTRPHARLLRLGLGLAALLGCTMIDGVVDGAECFAVALRAVDQVLSPASSCDAPHITSTNGLLY
jgi:CheY-like chemotaxis protein